MKKSSGDLPKSDPTALRPLNVPRPIKVQTGAGGRPISLHFRRRTRRVEQILEVWQVDDEWWRNRISRRYATLVLEDGLTVAVYRDLLTGRWYLQEG
jgi:hypothetical protein